MCGNYTISSKSLAHRRTSPQVTAQKANRFPAFTQIARRIKRNAEQNSDGVTFNGRVPLERDRSRFGAYAERSMSATMMIIGALIWTSRERYYVCLNEFLRSMASVGGMYLWSRPEPSPNYYLFDSAQQQRRWTDREVQKCRQVENTLSHVRANSQWKPTRAFWWRSFCPMNP